MSDLNRAILMGHLGADPELKHHPDGTVVLKLRLATNEAWLDKAKELQQRVEWHDVTIFGARAEGLAKILHKGDCVVVEGTLRTSSWEKDGIKRYRTEVVAREVCLTGKRTPASVAPDAPRGEGAPASARRSNGAAPAALSQDIPF